MNIFERNKTRDVTIHIFLFVYFCIQITGSQIQSHNDRNSYEFIVDLSDFRKNNESDRALGIHLSSKSLEVRSFEINPEDGSFPWIYENAGVRKGDKIVAIDGNYIDQLNNIHNAVQQLKQAKMLTFRREEKIKKKMMKDDKTQLLYIMRNNELLFTVDMRIAKFSSKISGDCIPRSLIYSNVDGGFGCTNFTNSERSIFQKSLLLLHRGGGCTFESKGWNTIKLRASGNIIINNEESIFEMPNDVHEYSSYNEVLSIPSVMISHASGERILKLLETNKNDHIYYGLFDYDSVCANSHYIIKPINITNIQTHQINEMKKSTKMEHSRLLSINTGNQQQQHISMNHLQRTSSNLNVKLYKQTESFNTDKVVSGFIHFSKEKEKANFLLSEFLVFDETNFHISMNTRYELTFVEATHNCTKLEFNDYYYTYNHISLLAIVKDAAYGHCSYDQQIQLCIDIACVGIVLSPMPLHTYASTVLISQWKTPKYNIKERWQDKNRSKQIDIKNENCFDKSYFYDIKNQKDCNTAIKTTESANPSILIMNSVDFKKIYEESQNRIVKTKNKVKQSYIVKHIYIMFTSNKNIDTLWSKLHMLSYPWNWPNELRQRERLYLKLKKGISSTFLSTDYEANYPISSSFVSPPQMEIALSHYFHQANDYYEGIEQS